MSAADLEQQVLCAAIDDPVFAKRALPVLRSHSWEQDGLKWIWGVIEKAVPYGEAPSFASFKANLDESFGYPSDDNDERNAMLHLLARTKKAAAKSPSTDLDLLRELGQYNAIGASLQKGVKLFSEGDLAQLMSSVEAGFREARTFDLDTDTYDIAEDWEARLSGYEEEDRGFKFQTPLATMNRVTGRGIPPGRLCMVMANTNVGKTNWAVDVGYTALIKSKAIVIYITTEERRKDAVMRFDGRITGIDKERLQYGELDPELRAQFRGAWKRKAELIKDRLIVREVLPNSSLASVDSIVYDVRVKFPSEPIMLVIDSPDHLTPTVRRESYRLDASGVYWQLWGYTRDPSLQPLATWVTCQAKLARAGKKLRIEDGSESYDKGRTADFAVGLRELPGAVLADKDLDALIVNIMKSRLGRVNDLDIYTAAHLGCSRFEEIDSADFIEEEE